MKILATLLFSTLILLSAQAQWDKIENFGGQMTGVEMINGVIYASGKGGVVKSTDNGNTWTEMNKGLGSMVVSEISFDNPFLDRTNSVEKLIAVSNELFAYVDQPWINSGVMGRENEGIYQYNFVDEQWEMKFSGSIRDIESFQNNLIVIGRIDQSGSSITGLYEIDVNTLQLTSFTRPGGVTEISNYKDSLLILTSSQSVFTTTDLINQTSLGNSGLPSSILGVYLVDNKFIACLSYFSSQGFRWAEYSNGTWQNTGYSSSYSYPYYMQYENENLIGFYWYGATYSKFTVSQNGYSLNPNPTFIPYLKTLDLGGEYILASIEGMKKTTDLDNPLTVESSNGITQTNERNFISTSQTLFRKSGFSLERSEDFGQTWTPSPLPHPDFRLNLVSGDFRSSTLVIYGELNGNPAYVSHDNGLSWIQTGSFYTDYIEVLNQEVILYKDLDDDQILISVDGGLTYNDRTINTGISDPWFTSLAGNANKLILASSFSGHSANQINKQSIDGGVSWTEIPDSSFPYIKISSLELINDTLFVLHSGHNHNFKISLHHFPSLDFIKEYQVDVEFKASHPKYVHMHYLDSVIFIEDEYNVFYNNTRISFEGFKPLTKGVNNGVLKHQALFFEDRVFVPSEFNGTFYRSYPSTMFNSPVYVNNNELENPTEQGSSNSLSEMHQGGFNIYPNPLDDNFGLNIQSDKAITSYVITDLNGREVAEKRHLMSQKINVSAELFRDSGMYIISVTFVDGTTAIERLVRR